MFSNWVEVNHRLGTGGLISPFWLILPIKINYPLILIIVSQLMLQGTYLSWYFGMPTNAWGRAFLLNWGPNVKSDLQNKLTPSSWDIYKLERVHKASPTQPGEDKYSDLRDKLNSVLAEKAKVQLVKCRRAFSTSLVINPVKSWLMLYGPLERVSILYNLKQKTTLWLEPQTTLLRYLEIITHPCIFWRPKHHPWHATVYLEFSGMPCLSDEIETVIDQPISPDEFLAALNSMKTAKAPGPDGFTLSYYKTFAVILAPHFVSANKFPDVSLLAHVTVIPRG